MNNHGHFPGGVERHRPEEAVVASPAPAPDALRTGHQGPLPSAGALRDQAHQAEEFALAGGWLLCGLVCLAWIGLWESARTWWTNRKGL